MCGSKSDSLTSKLFPRVSIGRNKQFIAAKEIQSEPIHPETRHSYFVYGEGSTVGTATLPMLFIDRSEVQLSIALAQSRDHRMSLRIRVRMIRKTCINQRVGEHAFRPRTAMPSKANLDSVGDDYSGSEKSSPRIK